MGLGLEGFDAGGGAYDTETAGVADGAGEFSVADPRKRVRRRSKEEMLRRVPLHATLDDWHYPAVSILGWVKGVFRPFMPRRFVRAVVKGIVG